MDNALVRELPSRTLDKVERLLDLLAELNEHPVLKGKLALHGGTAINLFMLDVPRLSVDIDLSYVGAISRDAMLAEAMRGLGIARGKRPAEVVGYLRDNIDLVAVEGPSLGTMESGSRHLYGARMDSVPCAWSRPGASAMARIVSRRASKRELPRTTRSRSLTPKRAKRREMKILAALNSGGAGKMVESVGSGCLPPHQASLVGMSAEVRRAAGVDKGTIPMQG